jgi:hypothetical protein
MKLGLEHRPPISKAQLEKQEFGTDGLSFPVPLCPKRCKSLQTSGGPHAFEIPAMNLNEGTGGKEGSKVRVQAPSQWGHLVFATLLYYR